MLARRVAEIQLSPTFRVNAAARQLREQGIDIVDLSVGEPDFPTPAAAREAGKLAIEEHRTRYTDNAGVLELRRAVAEKLRRDNGVDYAPEEVLVSPGAKASLYLAMMALFEDGDEVLIPIPCWVSYPEQVRLAGARPVFVEAKEEDGFKVRPEALEAAISPRTRGLVLNSPSNPTGASYEAAELAAIAEVCARHDLWIVSDEIYEKLLYDGRRFTSVASLGPESRRRTIVVNGWSKAFAMTGWRLGYAAGPREVIAAMGRLQSHSTSHPSSISQWAALEALRAGAAEVERMAQEFARRRDAVHGGLLAIPGLACVRPAGAFYAFPNVSAWFGRELRGQRLRTGEDVAMLLLREARVAVVPGEAFGSPRHVRLSYAASMERLVEGLRRIAEVLRSP